MVQGGGELADGGVTAVILNFAERSGGCCEGGVRHDREFKEGGGPWQVGSTCITAVAVLCNGFHSRQGLQTRAGQRGGKAADRRVDKNPNPPPSAPPPLTPWASSINADQRAAGGGAG